MYPYRVFVAYAREDQKLADKLHERLTELGLINMWDKTLPAGGVFPQEIKRRISCSHLFIPLITPCAMGRPWVQQEIGFAVGANVPVMPISTEVEPEGMIWDVQRAGAGPDLEGLGQAVNENSIEEALGARRDLPLPNLTCRPGAVERTNHIVRAVKDADSLSQTGRAGDLHVRERAAFSTFNIPDQSVSHSDWDRREGTSRIYEEHRTAKLAQRRELEKAAREHGCSLIITPSIRPKGLKCRAVRARLKTLVAFLKDMDDDKCIVAVSKSYHSNLLIVGDWFAAESRKPFPGVGFEQTLIAWYAPYVLRMQEDFDKELDACLTERGWKRKRSRVKAIKHLNPHYS